MSWHDVATFDQRLAKLNCKLCLLTMADSVLEERIIRNRDAAWRGYLKRYGETDDDVLGYYATQQNLLRDLCRKSALDTLIVDTTVSTIEGILDQVLNFWKAI